jgi:hypothetical protein
MLNYDLDISFADTTVEITLADGKQRIVRQVEIGGNVQGFDLFDCAIDQLYDDIQEECEDDPRFGTKIVFTTGDEDTIFEEGYDGKTGYDWLKPFVIKMEIIKYEAEPVTS